VGAVVAFGKLKLVAWPKLRRAAANVAVAVGVGAGPNVAVGVGAGPNVAAGSGRTCPAVPNVAAGAGAVADGEGEAVGVAARLDDRDS
jgi:hypothetical protein